MGTWVLCKCGVSCDLGPLDLYMPRYVKCFLLGSHICIYFIRSSNLYFFHLPPCSVEWSYREAITIMLLRSAVARGLLRVTGRLGFETPSPHRWGSAVDGDVPWARLWPASRALSRSASSDMGAGGMS